MQVYDTMRFLGSELISLAFAAAILAFCSGVKAVMRNLIKGGKNHDD